jgi:hypothetical protein
MECRAENPTGMSALPQIEGAGIDLIDADTPLRLEDAVKIAFPAGGMTLSGLRKEVARGTLAVELIAGKHFTTLADIKRMRELCRNRAKAPAYLNENEKVREAANTSGSSKTATNESRQASLLSRLNSDLQQLQKKPSKRT